MRGDYVRLYQLGMARNSYPCIGRAGVFVVYLWFYIRRELMRLVAEQIRTGWVVRPVNSVGTMGWSPKPWSAQFFRTYAQAQAYIRSIS
jgi:hypothetical protein